MNMTKVVDRSIIKGAARLLDIGGVLAWRGTRDPGEASARLMDEAWAMFGMALKDSLPSSALYSARGSRSRSTSAAQVVRDVNVLADETAAHKFQVRAVPESSTTGETDAVLRGYLTGFGKRMQDNGREAKTPLLVAVGYTDQDLEALSRNWTRPSEFAGETNGNDDPAYLEQRG